MLRLLFIAFIAQSCSRKEEKVHTPSLADIYITKAQDQTILEQERDSLSTLAYRQAVHEKQPRNIFLAAGLRNRVLAASKPDSSLVFLRNYLDDSQKRNDTLNSANAFYELAKHYDALQQSDSAFKFYNLSREKYEQRKDSLQIAEKLLLIADIYRRYNDYFGLESATTDVLKYIPELPKLPTDTSYLSIAYNNYGLAYSHLGDDANALRYYNLALKLFHDPLAIATVRNNIALVYMEEANYEKAIPILEQLAVQPDVLKDPKTMGMVAGNLGLCYFKTGRPNAKEWIERSVAEREKAGDLFGLIAGYLHFSDFYFNTNKAAARSYAIKALTIANRIHSNDDRLEAIMRLRKLSSGADRETYSSLYISVQDSINKVRQHARNQFAKYRFDATKASEENMRLKSVASESAIEIQRRKAYNSLLFLGICSISIIGVLLYFLLRKRHKHEQVLAVINTESRISKKLHDELANDVFNAMTFAGSQDLADTENVDRLLTDLDSVYARTRDISRENSAIDTGDAYPQHLRQMLAGYSSDKLNVIIQGIGDVKWNQVAAEKKVAVWRAVQELMINLKKHSGASLSAVRFNTNQRAISVIYTDNGSGIASTGVVAKNGLSNVENRIATIGGTVTFESESGKGLRVIITIPA